MESTQPPLLKFPEAVRNDLEVYRHGLASETEELMKEHIRPCVAVRSKRVSTDPLRRNAISRFFKKTVAEPKLGTLESKFGGIPYTEGDEDWDGYSFIGQLNLEHATEVLPPTENKLQGLIRFEINNSLSDIRVRWFPDPDLSVPADRSISSVANWEVRHEFSLEWTLPEGNDLEHVWPLKEPKWFEYDSFYPTGYNEDGFDEFHRVLGHKSSGLDEHYGFTPPQGISEDIGEYECLLRLTFDNQAGFAWGTNWIYFLVPRQDLKRGDLSRILATAANS